MRLTLPGSCLITFTIDVVAVRYRVKETGSVSLSNLIYMWLWFEQRAQSQRADSGPDPMTPT